MKHSRLVQVSTLVATLVTSSLAISAIPAKANPSNISGLWNVSANGSAGVLSITQSSNGSISGTIFGNCVEGFYIPTTRQLAFARKAGNCSAPVFQYYEAWVGRDDSPPGSTMAGDFSVWTTNSGTLLYSGVGVKFPFSAVQYIIK